MKNVYIISIVLNLTYVVVEAVAGLYYHSVGLLSDAGHNLSDIISLALALVALGLLHSHQRKGYTYGYRKMSVLISLTNAVGAGRMRQATRELVKAYIHGLDSAALDDVFELLAWNQGIGYFSSEIGPSTLFAAYKTIKNMEKQGKERAEICETLKEKFGEKNPDVKV